MRRRLRRPRLSLSRPRRGLSFPRRSSVESPARLLRGFLRLKVARKRATKRREARPQPHSPPVGVCSFGSPPDSWGLSAAREWLVASHPRPPALGVKLRSAGVGNTVLDAERRKNTGKKNDKRTLSSACHAREAITGLWPLSSHQSRR